MPLFRARRLLQCAMSTTVESDSHIPPMCRPLGQSVGFHEDEWGVPVNDEAHAQAKRTRHQGTFELLYSENRKEAGTGVS